MSQVALRLPDSLHQHAKLLAAEDDASLNQFIVTAVAEKISALRTEAFFNERAALATKQDGFRLLRKVRKVAPLQGDNR